MPTHGLATTTKRERYNCLLQVLLYNTPLARVHIYYIHISDVALLPTAYRNLDPAGQVPGIVFTVFHFPDVSLASLCHWPAQGAGFVSACGLGVRGGHSKGPNPKYK